MHVYYTYIHAHMHVCDFLIRGDDLNEPCILLDLSVKRKYLWIYGAKAMEKKKAVNPLLQHTACDIMIT